MRRGNAGAWWVMAVAAAAGCFGTAAAQTSGPPALAQSPPPGAEARVAVRPLGEDPERVLEIQVELAWMADPGTCPYYPCARVEGGSLEVGGYVPNEATRARALQIARQTSRLTVVDRLKVQPGLSARRSRVPADQLHRSATALMKSSFPQHDAQLRVACLPTGQVIVSGSLPSHEQKLSVCQRLRGIPGCTCVADHIQVGTSPPPSPQRTQAPVSRPVSQAQWTAVPVPPPSPSQGTPPAPAEGTPGPSLNSAAQATPAPIVPQAASPVRQTQFAAVPAADTLALPDAPPAPAKWQEIPVNNWTPGRPAAPQGSSPGTETYTAGDATPAAGVAPMPSDPAAAASAAIPAPGFRGTSDAAAPPQPQGIPVTDRSPAPAMREIPVAQAVPGLVPVREVPGAPRLDEGGQGRLAPMANAGPAWRPPAQGNGMAVTAKGAAAVPVTERPPVAAAQGVRVAAPNSTPARTVSGPQVVAMAPSSGTLAPGEPYIIEGSVRAADAAPPTPPRVQASPSPAALTQRVREVCRGASGVEVVFTGPGELTIRFRAPNHATADHLANRVMEMPELQPYRIQLAVNVDR